MMPTEPVATAKPAQPWQPPEYVDTGTFHERDLTVGVGRLAVPGTLTVLDTPGPHPPDVTIRVYDADNHLFFPGTGPSTPSEYEPAQHMDPTVVADIAGWLTEGASRTGRT